MPDRRDPVAPADDQARELALGLLRQARHAALSYTDALSGLPGISRIALATDQDGCPLTLISALAPHEAALRARPEAAIMVGEPGARGDPLTHPRLMIGVTARFIAPGDPARDAIRARYLSLQPKAALYIDFADFSLVRLLPRNILLNSGFGKAWRLDPADILRSA